MECRLHALVLIILTEYAGMQVEKKLDLLPVCRNFTSWVDTTSLTDFRDNTSEMTNLKSAGWYREVYTHEGVMVTECPRGSECGTLHQAWLSDPIPPFEKNTTTSVTVCIRGDGHCCARNITIEMANCYLFLVYNLVPLQGDEKYCFYAHTEHFRPVSTTTTIYTTTNTTYVPVDTTTNTTYLPVDQHDGPPVTLIAAIVGVAVLAAIVTGVVFSIKNRKPRRLTDLSNIQTSRQATRFEFTIQEQYKDKYRHKVVSPEVETSLSTPAMNGAPPNNTILRLN